MMEDANIFDKNYPSCLNYFVRIADGPLSKVVGTSSMTISKGLTLHFVSLIPNLDCKIWFNDY